LFSDSATNFGGFSFFEAGSRQDRKISVKVREARGFLDELGVGPIDLIKIDTEGSEFEILTALRPQRLQSVRWLSGELHGQRGFELLHYLSQWFDLSHQKPLHSRLSVFEASRKGS